MEAITQAGRAFLSSTSDMLQNALVSSNSAASTPHADSLTKDLVVSQILIHPIKSCRGTSVKEAPFDHQGLQYDRTWLIIDATTKKFYTARELPKMVLIHPRIKHDANKLSIEIPQSETGVAASTVEVSLQPSEDEVKTYEVVDGIFIWGAYVDGYAVSKEADEKLSAYFGKSVRLVRKGPSPRESGPTNPDGKVEWNDAVLRYQDFFPCLVASAESLRDVQATLTASVYPSMTSDSDAKAYKVPPSVNREYWTPEELSTLPITRFRPNIIVDNAPGASTTLSAWEEDGWTAAELFPSSEAEAPMGSEAEGKGRAGMYMLAKCARCMVPNIDPETGVRDNFLPYRVLQEYRQVDKVAAAKGKPCFGMLSVPREKEGVVRVGDVWRVTKTTDPLTRASPV
ncbi:MOSC, N-terminal beta barrel [Kalmanozyma brasiliensis GHG001]|uniref:Putative SET3 histone deacetylase complex component Snt1p n=1 Tax=Kalmanozyma brasiliensis (strain GHG001) TaxID=1365824 RepID=V5ETL0_KALBG|nr:MOSC, N-terminal beta barrel [Kalmanozyma brasiliensis GHG001]EST06403.1 MOSC, N-terminal beta barrel [Kalmanozyma brasiliensis GHG001]